jgi:hypothetical protein
VRQALRESGHEAGLVELVAVVMVRWVRVIERKLRGGLTELPGA